MFRAALTTASMITMVAGILAPAAQAEGNEELFRGKEISLLIGAGPGGGADTYGRLLARHYGRFLPGNPSVVAKNVPGAGGLRLANQIYNVAPRDGTEIASFATNTALEPLFGNKEAKYETTKFTWIGNMDSDSTGCGTWRHTGIKTWEDLRGRTETTFGASGPASGSSIDAKVMGVILGVKIRVIHGYQGTRTSNLAMERGELDGMCGLYMSTFRSQFLRNVRNGDMTVWMTFGRERAKDFPSAPTIYETARNDDDRRLAELVFGQEVIGRPFSAPPGLSEERRIALRSGFMATMKDAAFLAEAERTGVSISPMSGEETEQQYQAFYGFPTEVIDRTIAIIHGGKTEP